MRRVKRIEMTFFLVFALAVSFCACTSGCASAVLTSLGSCLLKMSCVYLWSVSGQERAKGCVYKYFNALLLFWTLQFLDCSRRLLERPLRRWSRSDVKETRLERFINLRGLVSRQLPRHPWQLKMHTLAAIALRGYFDQHQKKTFTCIQGCVLWCARIGHIPRIRAGGITPSRSIMIAIRLALWYQHQS